MTDTIAQLLKDKSGIRLDVGCGHRKQAGFVGLDIRELPTVDIIWDMEQTPYPLPDGCCLSIVASHVVEHINPARFGFVNVMNEWWRIMKLGGRLMVVTPYAGSFGYYQDPTHVNPCLAHETPLITKDGIQSIGELSGASAEVWNGETWETAAIINNGRKQLIKLLLSNGLSFRCTPDHIISTKHGPLPASETLNVPVDFISPPTHMLPNEFDHNFVMIGFAQGDGTYHRASSRWKYLNIGVNDFDVYEYATQCGWELNEGSSARQYMKSINNKISEIIEPWILPVPLPERRLTSQTMRLDPQRARSFLRGLYSANGSVKQNHGGRVCLKSTCRDLIHDVQIMLTLFGIRSYITTSRKHDVRFDNGLYQCRESYDLNITSTDIEQFRNHIGFIQRYKQEALEVAASKWRTGYRQPCTVVAIDDDEVDDVFDFQLSNIHWASVAGLRIHNCNEATWAYFCPFHASGLYGIYTPKPWRIVANAWHTNGNLEVVLEKVEIEEVPEETEEKATEATNAASTDYTLRRTDI